MLVEIGVGQCGNYAGWLDNFSRITTFRQKNESITGGGQYGQYGPSYDDNSNITGVESSWLTLNSMTLENDNVGRLLEAKVGVMVSGAITGSNIWNTEQWKDGSGGATGLTQTGNWKRYKNSRFDGSSTGVNIDGTMTFNLANEMTDKADAGITNSTNNPDPQPEYNKVGQLIKDDKTTANVGYRYTYDAWGRMRFARSHAAGNPVVQEYRYNGLGHQIARRFDANLDGVVDSSDPWRHSLYNERWQEVGVWHGSESLPREVFVMHAASRNGYGSSSYIDHVLLRDRDYRGGERDPVEDLPLPDGILEERNYILQNWRYDVIAVVTSIGDVVERRRYDAYGRPISVSPADVGAQGGVEGTDGYLSNNDAAAYNTLYFAGQVKWSTDLADGTTRRPSGTLNSSDYARFNDYFNDGYTGGIGKVSAAEVDIRRGYAGYQYDEILAGSGIISDKVVSKYNVRHRVLSSDDGKWNRRDPLGFVDGMGLYEYVRSGPMMGVDPSGLVSSVNPASLAACGFTAAELAMLGLGAGAAVVPLVDREFGYKMAVLWRQTTDSVTALVTTSIQCRPDDRPTIGSSPRPAVPGSRQYCKVLEAAKKAVCDSVKGDGARIPAIDNARDCPTITAVCTQIAACVAARGALNAAGCYPPSKLPEHIATLAWYTINATAQCAAKKQQLCGTDGSAGPGGSLGSSHDAVIDYFAE